MQVLDLTLPTPEENLACDEALLDHCEENGPEVLRFWESPSYFVVLGYSNKTDSEVYRHFCEENEIPILRRVSGGGTVLQGPGCLNFALILKIPESGPLVNMVKTTHYILERNKRALEKMITTPSPQPSPPTGARGIEEFPSASLETTDFPLSPLGRGQGEGLSLQGTSDLTLGNLKFSGNAQRRKRKSLLFHGSFLCNFEIDRIEKTLRIPSKQPPYRHNRTHQNFLTNFCTSSLPIKEALQKEWNALKNFDDVPYERIRKLTEEKYSKREWNHKF